MVGTQVSPALSHEEGAPSALPSAGTLRSTLASAGGAAPSSFAPVSPAPPTLPPGPPRRRSPWFLPFPGRQRRHCPWWWCVPHHRSIADRHRRRRRGTRHLPASRTPNPSREGRSPSTAFALSWHLDATAKPRSLVGRSSRIRARLGPRRALRHTCLGAGWSSGAWRCSRGSAVSARRYIRCRMAATKASKSGRWCPSTSSTTLMRVPSSRVRAMTVANTSETVDG